MEASATAARREDGPVETGNADPWITMEPKDVPVGRLRPSWQSADYARLNELIVRERKAVCIKCDGMHGEWEQWQLCIAQQIGAQNVAYLEDRANDAIYLLPRPCLPGVVLESMLSDRWA